MFGICSQLGFMTDYNQDANAKTFVKFVVFANVGRESIHLTIGKGKVISRVDYDAEANLVVDKWTDGYAEAGKAIPSGAIILLTRPYSMHPDDWYLSVVMAQLPENDITPYVTWGCNVSFGDTSFFDGHYFKDKWEAFDDWKKR